MLARSWRSNRERVVPFPDFSSEVCKVTYTANAIEPVKASLRKLLQYRGSSPNDASVITPLSSALTRFGVEAGAVHRAPEFRTRTAQYGLPSPHLGPCPSTVSAAGAGGKPRPRPEPRVDASLPPRH